MAVDDIQWRYLFEYLLAEQPPTPCGGFFALLELIYVHTRFTRESSTDA